MDEDGHHTTVGHASSVGPSTRSQSPVRTMNSRRWSLFLYLRPARRLTAASSKHSGQQGQNQHKVKIQLKPFVG
eukprot:7178050-Pyramimonas_sp.AAC.1